MEIEIIYQLILAFALGGLIGLEREIKRREAGLQTYSLVALGSCLFTIIGFELFDFFFEKSGVSFDPSRIIQAIAVGIGFIGAGVIFRYGAGVVGLTTAAGLWVTASIGVAVGVGLYLLAVIATVLALFILVVLGFFEKKAFKKEKEEEKRQKDERKD